jgi:hypothetical protein
VVEDPTVAEDRAVVLQAEVEEAATVSHQQS